ncbi:unnamed protein product [Adineta ricciae]|uniref:Uncharacterized protein n=1 Tax=Adineta ricciae TaxID=249248 RepID=A0A815YRP8_ADIRI|nr:unnamed protein product [Adineta ricciae]
MSQNVVAGSYIIYNVGNVEPGLIDNVKKQITDAGGRITYEYSSVMKKESYVRQQAWNSNQHITLPSIALVNLTPRYTIACPGYTLVGNPIPSSSLSLVIRYNSSFLMNNISIVNVYKHLHENTSWFNTKPSDKRIDNIIKRMRESMANPPNELYYPTHTRFSNASIVNWILLALVSGVVAYYIYQHKQKTILGSI